MGTMYKGGVPNTSHEMLLMYNGLILMPKEAGKSTCKLKHRASLVAALISIVLIVMGYIYVSIGLVILSLAMLISARNQSGDAEISMDPKTSRVSMHRAGEHRVICFSEIGSVELVDRSWKGFHNSGVEQCEINIRMVNGKRVKMMDGIDKKSMLNVAKLMSQIVSVDVDEVA